MDRSKSSRIPASDRPYGATSSKQTGSSRPAAQPTQGPPPTEQTALLHVQVAAAPTVITSSVQPSLQTPTDDAYRAPPPVEFRLYAVRWYILLLFSLMSLYNNMLCYTFTSVHKVSHRYYHGKRGEPTSMPLGFGMSTLVSCYFITYIATSFPAAWFIERYGLKAGVLCGAWLQAVGCFVRVLATPEIGSHPLTIDGVEDPNFDQASVEAFNGPHGEMGLLLVGQLIVSLGQAFFVNPAPLLAATWFGVNERTIATTIAVNANTLGIAVAYLLGPAIVDTTADLPKYVWLCFGLTLFTALLSTVYFPARPKTPPSHSQTVEPEDLTLSESPFSDTSSADATSSSLPPAREVRVSLIQVDGANILQVVEEQPLEHTPEAIDEEPRSSGECEECAEAEEDDEDDVLRSSSEECEVCERSSDVESESSYDEEEWRGHGHSHASGAAHAHSHGLPPTKGYGSRVPSSSSIHNHHHHYQYQNYTRGPAIIPPPASSSSSQQGGGRRNSRSSRRTKSTTELALEAHYLSLAAPPCSFVVRETIAEERARLKNASRILASWHGLKKMFLAEGFGHTLLVFGVSEATINGLSAFMNQIVEPWGYTSMRFVGFMVCALIGMCMVGSAAVGFVVDRTKAFKFWIMLSLFGSAFSLLYLIHIGPLSPTHIWIAVLSMGFWIGPIQPLSIETAVEVTFPAPESSVTAVQQVLGNIFSAALFPLILLCQNPQTHSMTAALYLVFFCLVGTGAVYSTFDGEYRRMGHEREKERAHRELHRRLHDQAKKTAQAQKQALMTMNADGRKNGVRVEPLTTNTPSA